ncbi:VOC family protein [Seonamhaeicola sp. MEBiC1930]|uniref:VOC family protein n=1 Tax=Seonamhaeicola sp. MEBiC01930 TaxID=2976768 RepID=UPI003251971F
MIKSILISTLLCISFYSYSQSFTLKLDHSTIQVVDIEKSMEFYTDILKFKEIEAPNPENRMIRYLAIGNNQQLHIAQVDYGEIKINKVLHIAFSVNDFDGYIKYLVEKDIEYSTFNGKSKTIQIRSDGVRQVYFQDPDGYWIEVNDAKY